MSEVEAGAEDEVKVGSEGAVAGAGEEAEVGAEAGTEEVAGVADEADG